MMLDHLRYFLFQDPILVQCRDQLVRTLMLPRARTPADQTVQIARSTAPVSLKTSFFPSAINIYIVQ